MAGKNRSIIPALAMLLIIGVVFMLLLRGGGNREEARTGANPPTRQTESIAQIPTSGDHELPAVTITGESEELSAIAPEAANSPAPEDPAPTPMESTLNARVVLEGTTDPITNARVQTVQMGEGAFSADPTGEVILVDEQGRFNIPGTKSIGERGTAWMEVFAPGFATVRVLGTSPKLLVDARDGLLLIPMRPALSIRGRVVDEADVPIGGARIGRGSMRVPSDGGASAVADYLIHWGSAVSGTDGTFELEGTHTGYSFRLDFEHDHFYPTTMDAVESGTSDLKVVMKRAGQRLLIQVLDVREEPVAGAAVHVQPASEQGAGYNPASGRKGVTDERGMVELAGFDDRTHVAIWASWKRGGTPSAANDDKVTLTVRSPQ